VVFDYSPQQADNFSMASGAVDPRTGMYVVNINLGNVVGNNGQGSSFLFIQSYSSLTGLALNSRPIVLAYFFPASQSGEP
jgi:hypothetical protein